ncbi:MAG: hypothetical protein ACREQB_03835, partial [Candidatus Binataceae bacterium]
MAFTAVLLAKLGWLDVPLDALLLIGSVAFADIATTAMADVQETFKRVYLMAVDAVPDSNVLSAQFERTKKFKAGPDFLYFNVKLETGGSVANVGDGLKLPRAAHPKRKQGRAGISHTYTVIAVGGQSIPLTEDNKQAFVENLDDQFDDALVRVKNDKERQDNGDSRGVLAIVLTVAGAPTYGVEKAYGLNNGGPGSMLFIEDMDVAGINSGTGAERGRSKIAAAGVDYDNNTITTSAAIAALAIGDYFVLCNDNTATGSDAVNNYNNESIGALTIAADTGTFENIARASFRRWKAVVMTNAGVARPISERLIASLDARVTAKAGRKPSAYYTTRGISIELQDQLSTMRRFEGEKTKMKGGYEGLSIKGRTVLEGDWCPKGQFFACNFDSEVVGAMDLVKMGFVDLDGARLHRIEGRHAYRAELWFPHNNIVFLASTWGRLGDLSDDNS